MFLTRLRKDKELAAEAKRRLVASSKNASMEVHNGCTLNTALVVHTQPPPPPPPVYSVPTLSKGVISYILL